MKTEKNILFAFLLNLLFSVFEIFGGMFTGSIAIISDAVHDMGDAVSIGISYLLEKKSQKQPDKHYTYGYLRYSVVGGVISTLILTVGSVGVIFGAIKRLFSPAPIYADGMLWLAVVGVIGNLLAAFATHRGESINQKAVNLHMLEDVLGWITVLFGSILMKLTGLIWLDSVLSIGVACFILIHAAKNLKKILDLFLEKVPCGIDIAQLEETLCKIDGVVGVHHIHLRSIDGIHHDAAMHVETDADPHTTKEKIRILLQRYDITHVTLELENKSELCENFHCDIGHGIAGRACHHH